MKNILVYFTTFGPNIGGSEYLAFTIVQALCQHHNVTLAMRERGMDPAEVSELYGVSIDWSRVTVIDLQPRGLLAKVDRCLKFVAMRRLRELGKGFDSCISCANPVDFGRSAIHFVYMMTFDINFQSWAQEWRQRGKWTVRHRLCGWRNRLAYFLSGSRTPCQIVRDSREIVLPNSNYVREMIERYYGCKTSRVFYPPTLFETELPNRRVRENIGYIGRIQAEKRVAELVEIVRRAREKSGVDLKFHIAGVVYPDAYGQRISRLAQDNPWVVLHGPVTGSVKKEFLSSVAIALHGRRCEEFGISITEYLKAGAVPIVPRAGGSDEVVDNPELTYETDNEAAELLLRLLLDKDFYQESLGRCQKRAKLFSQATYLLRQQKLLNDFLA